MIFFKFFFSFNQIGLVSGDKLGVIVIGRISIRASVFLFNYYYYLIFVIVGITIVRLYLSTRSCCTFQCKIRILINRTYSILCCGCGGEVDLLLIQNY